MVGRVTSFRDLVAWQKSVELSVACYALTRRFPASERYALSSQLQRAAVSIPANIAEGYGKSLRELETLLIIASREEHRRITGAPWPLMTRRADLCGVS